MYACVIDKDGVVFVVLKQTGRDIRPNRPEIVTGSLHTRFVVVIATSLARQNIRQLICLLIYF